MAKFHYIDQDEQLKDPFAGEQAGDSEFEKLLANEGNLVSTRRYKVGEQVSGPVIRVGADFIFVDLGGKTTGALGIDEWQTADGRPPKVGDTVQAYVREDNGSEVVLTKSLRRSETDSSMLRDAFQSQVPVEAKVEKVTKGGFEVSLSGKRGFVPISQMDLVRIENPETYIGNVFKFMITEFSQGGRNIVLSRRPLLKEEQEARVQDLVRNLEVGQTKRATITRLATFGAFADIGGLEGLIPISMLSWKREKRVEDVVKVGDVVTVKVAKVEHAPRLKVALSMKDAGEDPWLSMGTQLSPGNILKGKIARLTDIGAFVTVGDGVDGLVHISQLTWDKRVKHPREVVKEGQDVDVHILTVDLEHHKLSLSIKGPLTEDKARELKAKKAGHTLDKEEADMLAEWEEYKKNAPSLAAKQSEGAEGVFANAFARATRRK